MEITGKIKKIMDLQDVSDRFRKREFVLATDLNTPYPQYILFQTTQDKCALLDNLKTNDEVKVFFNIRGREWTNPEGQIKYFVTLEAWRIDKFVPVEGGSTSTQQAPADYNTAPSEKTPAYSTPATNTPTNDIQTGGDDLPF